MSSLMCIFGNFESASVGNRQRSMGTCELSKEQGGETLLPILGCFFGFVFVFHSIFSGANRRSMP